MNIYRAKNRKQMPVFPRDRGFGKRQKQKVNHFLRGTLSPSGTSPISFCREHRGVLVAQSDWKYTKYTRVALVTSFLGSIYLALHVVLIQQNKENSKDSKIQYYSEH